MHDTDILIRGTGVVVAAGADLRGIGPAGVARGCDDAALKQHIGQRGIRYKDRATRLALAAARLAMQQAGLAPDGYRDLDDPRCAVIVASSFGNVDTVLRCAGQIAEHGSSVLSPMDLPNASANVIAATLAIWFGLRGPNLLLASGLRSGEDALLFASNMLRSGAAERVLVCGAEAAQPALAPLFAAAGQADSAPADVAAAVLLERGAPGASAGVHLEAGGPGLPLRLHHRASGAALDAAHCPLAGSALLAQAHGAAGVLSVISAYGRLCQAGAEAAA